MSFQDHFSKTAPAYAAFRPRYPGALFSALAQIAPDRRLAWDCATGNGQAALGLAEHFDAVVATDASPQQIAAAQPHPRVTYRVARAEACGLDDATVSLVTVAQALHWLDLPAFFGEVERALKPGGVLAVWCYNLCVIEPAIDAALRRFYTDVVGPWWAPERALVESGYREIELPFEEVALPSSICPPGAPLAIEAELTLPALAGYVRTWSATQRCAEALGADPVETLVRELAPLWGRTEGPAGGTTASSPAGQPRPVRWPLTVRAGRKGYKPAD